MSTFQLPFTSLAIFANKFILVIADSFPGSAQVEQVQEVVVGKMTGIVGEYTESS